MHLFYLILILFVAWVRTDQEGTKGTEFPRNSEDVFALRFQDVLTHPDELTQTANRS